MDTTTAAGLISTPYQDLATTLRGDLITPDDPGYDEARAVYNGMIDKHPAAIARCRDTADVITCVHFGREHHVAIAVRGGGHNAAGLGVGDDALVIDLSELRSTTVDPENHTVRVDAGCTWGDVDHATVAFGMATPSGFLASTGVAGLTLGRRHRLPRAALRPHRRQPARRRRRPGRRVVHHRQRELPRRPVLGPARRRRELRRRHVVHVPLPRHRRARDDHRRPGAVRLRRHPRGHALVPGTAAVPAGGAERLDRAGRRPAGTAVPGGAVGQEGLRHRLVLHRAA